MSDTLQSVNVTGLGRARWLPGCGRVLQFGQHTKGLSRVFAWFPAIWKAKNLNMRNDAAEMTPARQWLNAARQNRIRILNRWKEDAKPQRLNR
jgi:hypothetical protein